MCVCVCMCVFVDVCVLVYMYVAVDVFTDVDAAVLVVCHNYKKKIYSSNIPVSIYRTPCEIIRPCLCTDSTSVSLLPHGHRL